MKLFLKAFVVITFALSFTSITYLGLHKLTNFTNIEHIAEAKFIKFDGDIVTNNSQITPVRPEWPSVKPNTDKPRMELIYDVVIEDWPTIKHSDPTNQPLLRVAPRMPSRANKSGNCKFYALVNKGGKVIKLSNLTCSEAIFEKPTKKAVMQWRFLPKIVNGKSVSFRTDPLSIEYHFTDANGFTMISK